MRIIFQHILFLLFFSAVSMSSSAQKIPVIEGMASFEYQSSYPINGFYLIRNTGGCLSDRVITGTIQSNDGRLFLTSVNKKPYTYSLSETKGAVTFVRDKYGITLFKSKELDKFLSEVDDMF